MKMINEQQLRLPPVLPKAVHLAGRTPSGRQQTLLAPPQDGADKWPHIYHPWHSGPALHLCMLWVQHSGLTLVLCTVCLTCGPSTACSLAAPHSKYGVHNTPHSTEPQRVPTLPYTASCQQETPYCQSLHPTQASNVSTSATHFPRVWARCQYPAANARPAAHSRHGGAGEAGGAHLRQHTVQPLQRSIQV